MDDVDREIQSLREGWAFVATQRKLRAAWERAQYRERNRDDLRTGVWKPERCVCDDCLRAVLSLDYSLACPRARGQSWYEYGREPGS